MAEGATAKAWRSRIVGQDEVAPDQLLANPANFRRHPKRQLEALEEALGRVGWVQRVVVNRRTGHVVDGHARVELGLRRGEATIPVVYVDLSEAEEHVVLATLDPLAAMASTDDAMLEQLLGDLRNGDAEVERLLASVHGEQQKPSAPGQDDAPDTQDEVVSRPGDVWLLGSHRLLCGSSTDMADVARVMGDERASLVFTDPPYNVDYEGAGGKIKNDDMTPAQFEDFLRQAFRCAAWAMHEQAVIYVCHPDSPRPLCIDSAFGECFRLSATIIWVKPAATLGWQDYRPQHEPMLYGWKAGNGRHFYCGDRTQTTVWQISRDHSGEYKHPTQKPVALAERAIINSSKPGQLVLDPFSGSGSTLIACEKTGRHGRFVEVDPRFVDVAVRRWQAFTGGQARLRAPRGNRHPTFDAVAAKRAG